MVIPARPHSRHPAPRPSAPPNNLPQGSPDIPPFLQQQANKAHGAYPQSQVPHQRLQQQPRRSPPSEYRPPSRVLTPRHYQQPGQHPQPSPPRFNPPPFGPIHTPQAAPRPSLFAGMAQQLGLSLRPQRLLWLGGGFLAMGLFLSNGLGRWGSGLIAKSFHRDLCQEMVQPSVSLSRAQLTELLTVPERSPKATIRQQAPDPYCTLTDLEIRAGVTAQREAYPLAFDPDTWLVMLYEGDEYAGYAFRFE